MDYKRTFTELILPLKNNLFRYSFSFLKDKQKAEDIVQETMIRLWNCREKWNEMQNIQGYSLGVARHLCLDELRKKRVVYSELNVIEDERSPENNPMDSYSSKEMLTALKNAAMQLPEKQQICFHLREEEGRAYNEIAEIAGITMEQVKVNIFRARNFIKNKILKAEGYGIQ